jgi:chorismate mutase/prephenate dehydratase
VSPLKSHRNKIDEIDKELIALLGRRMEAVRTIGAFKGQDQEAPIHDPNREHDLFAFWASEGEKAGLPGFFLGRLLREILSHSRRDQERHLRPAAHPEAPRFRVGYHGAVGSYAELATEKLLQPRTDGPTDKTPFETFSGALDALEGEEIDYLLLPLENTVSGSIHEAYREITNRGVYLVDEEVWPVQHCLAALPGTRVEALDVIRSDPDAFQQCQRFFRSLVGAKAENWYASAAAAASVGVDGGPSVGAICSPDAARMAGLEILTEEVSDHKDNRTRYVLLSRSAEEVDSRIPAKTSLLLTVNHHHGALAECLQAFAREGLNLSKLESRPVPQRPWEYLFYIDVEGNVQDERMRTALDAMREFTGSLRVLGCYPSRTKGEPTLALPPRRLVGETGELTASTGDSAPPAKISCSHPISDQLSSLPESGRKSVVKVGEAEIGSDRFILIAGPCAVESRSQIMVSAELVAAAGGLVLRGGAFKPRSSPYSFQGLGKEGLDYLAEAGRTFGLPVVTECLRVEDVPMVAEAADMIQVGARNMQNFELLKVLGRLRQPILLKRGMSATVKELLQAAEYILAGGNHQVVLCERGIRTFETATRSTLDVSSVPVLKELTHLPVIVDPSHAAGRRELVIPLAHAAAAVGADGLIVEVHPVPSEALCDADQALSPDDLLHLVASLRPIVEAQGRRF